MENFMRIFGRILLVLMILTFSCSESWGLGELTLIAKTENGKIKISLIEEEGHYFGEIREGITVVTPFEVILEPKYIKINIGEQEYLIERQKLGKFISYGGVIQDNRGISAQAGFNGPLLTISGTVEDDRNDLIDFEIIANDKKGTFELRWNDKTLFLKKIEDEYPGFCEGELVRKDLGKSGSFWCSSSDSLEDVLFNNPEHILAWLVVFFVN